MKSFFSPNAISAIPKIKWAYNLYAKFIACLPVRQHYKVVIIAHYPDMSLDVVKMANLGDECEASP